MFAAIFASQMAALSSRMVNASALVSRNLYLTFVNPHADDRKVLWVGRICGLFLVALGVAGFGGAIKFIPHPVVVGFTSGIALIIFTSQIKDLLGLEMGDVPAEFFAKWRAYADHIGTLNPQAMGLAAVPLLLVSIPYVIWLDRRLAEPRDGAWHFGQLLLNRRRLVEREQLYDFFRAWAVKGFFLAFMISIVPGNWAMAVGAESAWIVADPIHLSIWLIWVMFMIDVVFATVGYVLTLKPLDAHIRSANPYAAGWMAALICYPPFIMMQPGGPLDYRPGTMDKLGLGTREVGLIKFQCSSLISDSANYEFRLERYHIN